MIEPKPSATPDADAQDATLTTRQGHPVSNNQNLRTVGDARPRHPGELPVSGKDHATSTASAFPNGWCTRAARALTAYFEAYGSVGDEPIAKYTRAKLFQTPKASRRRCSCAFPR